LGRREESIGGYIPGNKGVGELLIGEYPEHGKLYHIKRLTAGLNQFNRSEIFKALQDLKTKQVLFVNLPEENPTASTCRYRNR
jgi:ATP-dependent DNA ligase